MDNAADSTSINLMKISELLIIKYLVTYINKHYIMWQLHQYNKAANYYNIIVSYIVLCLKSKRAVGKVYAVSELSTIAITNNAICIVIVWFLLKAHQS